MKVMTKEPGLGMTLAQTELDFSYKHHFTGKVRDAYERLIFEVARGDHSLFVRGDELELAWKLFTPMLKTLESTKSTLSRFSSTSPSPLVSKVWRF